MSVIFETVNGEEHSLLLTLGAQRRLEKALGITVPVFMRDLQDRLGAESLVQFYAAALKDGKGVSVEKAESVVSLLGGLATPDAAEYMMKAVTDVFSDLGDETETGNAAAPKKKAPS